MKIYPFFKNIFARLWALWALVTFISTFLIVFPVAMLSNVMKEVKGQTYFIKVSKIWMRFWLLLIGCKIKIEGLQHFDAHENYIVVFNHNAMLDVPLSAPFVPGANKTIAKDSFAKVPIFGAFYKRGAVLVNRKDENSRSKSFDAMLAVLKKGMHMSIYPEGTRNRTDAPLKPFYDGAFRLAKVSGKKIIPCVIKGTKEAMPIEKKFYLLPTSLTMTFLSPISPEEKNVQQLKDAVFNIMLNEYLNYKSKK